MALFKRFSDLVNESVAIGDFVKITLSKPLQKQGGLRNVYARLIWLKNTQKLSLTYHYKTNDQVKNHSVSEGLEVLESLLMSSFRTAILFTLREDLQVFVSKKKLLSFKTTNPSFTAIPSLEHNQPKHNRIAAGLYLKDLGITDDQNELIPKMADKFRQINKYIEIMESLFASAKLPKTVKIVDMGSGKGYLTFALYDYFVVQRKMNLKITGIELRHGLVDKCNVIAKKHKFEHLRFECKSIETFDDNSIDVLIALHACDTATDDAILKGVTAKANLIVCAPCCHKQIRQSLKGSNSNENPILKYGIFKERQLEMVTDTLRALILEKNHYKTNIFEFVSNEHTRKNILLVATRSTKKNDINQIDAKIKSMKESYGITEHYLETIV